MENRHRQARGMKSRAVLTSLTTLALLCGVAPTAFAGWNDEYSSDGISIGKDEVNRIKGGLDPRTGARTTQSYEYKTELACPIQEQTQDGDFLGCGNLNAQCDPTSPDIGPGPLTRVLRRELDPGT